MNLYFRLFALLLSRFFSRKPLGWLDTSTLASRVWPNDLDNNRHMNNGRYLTVMDLGRLDILLGTGLWRDCWRNRWFPLVGALKMDYRKPLPLFQSFELKTRVVGWDPKWLYLEQWFEAGGTAYAKATLQCLLWGPRGKVPTAELLRILGWKKPSPRLSAGTAGWLRPKGRSRG